MYRLMCALILATPLLFPGTASAEQVHCYDSARQSVSVVGSTKCAFEIVTPAQADKIRAARRSYILRSQGNGPPLPDKNQTNSFGSGFFVHPSGYVVTNHHVTASCSQISLLTQKGDSIPATLIASSQHEDLALLKTGDSVSAYASFDQQRLAKGAMLKIIGYPVLKLPRRNPKAVTGAYIGDRPVPQGGSILQIDTKVWQGSSGSPVIDRNGSVVGVIFAKKNIPAVFQKTGQIAAERAYAVPARTLTAFMKRNSVAPSYANQTTKSATTAHYLVRVDCRH